MEEGEEGPSQNGGGKPHLSTKKEGFSQQEALDWRTLLSPGRQHLDQGWSLLVLVRRRSPASWGTLLGGLAGIELGAESWKQTPERLQR